MCEKKSKRLYLYNLYVQFCEEKKTSPVSSITYRRTFCTKYNMSFFKPKKDQCLKCNKYELADAIKKQDLLEDYEAHIQRKNDCNNAKTADKERAQNEESFQTVTFDLQSVLQLPCSEVSQMFYTRKLCVYNLTIYEGAKSNDGYCYFWNEVNGKRGSNEIGTILL